MAEHSSVLQASALQHREQLYCPKLVALCTLPEERQATPSEAAMRPDASTFSLGDPPAPPRTAQPTDEPSIGGALRWG